MREGKLCGQGVTAGWWQRWRVPGLRKDLTMALMLLVLVVKKKEQSAGRHPSEGEDDMTKATLSWGCSVHVQTSYYLNCRELAVKLRVGLSGQESDIVGSRSAVSPIRVPCCHVKAMPSLTSSLWITVLG